MGNRRSNTFDRTLIKADENSIYGIITRSLGNNKFQVYCSDGIMRIASIRGNMIKRVWMKENDLVLCSLREGGGTHCDIELKYTDAEIKTLKEGRYITDAFLNQENGGTEHKIDFKQL
ncbi:translation initiation factor 1A [Pancytospora epiphaga]|nr:translation initiation factor 1A [Pancytospora epiphaga]